jgi:hypothetical protein
MHPVTVVTTNQAPPDDDRSCGAIYVTQTDGLTFTLDNITAAYDGCELTFVNFGAAAAVSMTIAIDASDYIVGTCLDSSKAGATESDFFSTASHKGIYSSKAASYQGDKLTVVADASNNIWHIMHCVGFWIQIP